MIQAYLPHSLMHFIWLSKDYEPQDSVGLPLESPRESGLSGVTQAPWTFSTAPALKFQATTLGLAVPAVPMALTDTYPHRGFMWFQKDQVGSQPLPLQGLSFLITA